MLLCSKRWLSILSMNRVKRVTSLKFGIVMWLFMLGTALYASFEAGRRLHSSTLVEVAYAQAMLAVFHHKSYDEIERFLERGCDKAALLVAKEMKKLQVVLLSENILIAGNPPELLEYVEQRDSQLFDAIVAGRVPELESYDLPCFEPECECDVTEDQ